MSDKPTPTLENANTKRVAKRYYRKKNDLFTLLSKIKLWPSRSGQLHGIRSLELRGEKITIMTHCGHNLTVRNSRNCKAARWLRNKFYICVCPGCKVPGWKLEKYGQTFFSRFQGAVLKNAAKEA
jgi:pyrrolysyl-tRNA synthetase-like protein